MAAVLLLLPLVIHAQDASNLRMRWLPVSGDTLRLDTLSIVPGSVHLFAEGTPIGGAMFRVEPYAGLVIWEYLPPTDSVFARYRVMPLHFTAERKHKDLDRLLDEMQGRPDPFRYTPPGQQGDLMGLRGLNRSGSISRGILFGNNQDLSVNSTLNLELSGRITDRISVLASITDNNIPIQAGGNTLELQDFDQVFIKLFEEDRDRPGNAWELIAGDFVLRSPKSHFLTYLKKAKGLGFDSRYGSVREPSGSAGASLAISKGKFARNQIQGLEAVQGPYRLRGDAGEPFIVVLSGTERVFIDGQLLLRGQENDYVIDYNTAEVTFTAKRMITKDRRITVEFQYSDKNYARSMVRVDNAAEIGMSTVRFSLYSEQDHRNQQLQQQLSEEDRAVLEEAGDDPLSAVVPGVDSTGFAADQVLYRLTDSLGYSPVYVFSTDPATALYRITFTQVGAGNGDYVQDSFTPNGRVFRWMAPDTVDGLLVRKGDHAPVRLLIAPRSQQLVILGLDHRFSDRTNVSTEVAFSNLDRNTFSDLDGDDDQGLGLMVAGEHAIPLNSGDSTLQLVLASELESLTRDFRFVERYRAVEFERNWNAIGLPLDGGQLLAGARVGLRGKRIGELFMGTHTFQVRDRYNGWKQELVSDLHIGKADITGTASWLNSTAPRRTDFLRHKFRVRQRLRRFTLGFQDEHERNVFDGAVPGMLANGSYQFYDWEAFIQSPEEGGNRWRLSAGQRYERAFNGTGLAPSTRATAYGVSFDLARNPRNRLNTSFTYRQLTILDTSITSQRPEDTYLARVEYNLTAWKGAVLFNTFYEFGSGLEQRQEYIYLQVPSGQGLFIWIDYNNDGIKDLNEFELANFGYEADHIRVYVPSNQFVRVFSNQFSSSLDLRPGVRWAEATGLKGVLGKFSDLASFRVDRKTGTDNALLALDPFQRELSDTSLTSFVASTRNTVYYDRTSRTWSIDHTFQNDRSRSLLLNGFESRSRTFNTARVRWNTTRQWTTDVEGERGRVTNSSDLLAGRTFAIDEQAVRPRITWQPNTSMRAVMYWKFSEKENVREFGGEQAEISDLGLELRYNTAGKGSLQATVNIVNITYTGAVDSPLGNEMLSGLKPGSNMTWSLSIQRNLSNNLQVDITYNGRSSEGVPNVHVGGAQVRAFF